MKEQCGDSVLLFRTDDFYETFGSDAEITARSSPTSNETTLRNLELFRNIRDLSRRGSFLEFLDGTSTPTGSRTRLFTFDSDECYINKYFK
jgi:DNA mismatch repair ATPase MutS